LLLFSVKSFTLACLEDCEPCQHMDPYWRWCVPDPPCPCGCTECRYVTEFKEYRCVSICGENEFCCHASPCGSGCHCCPKGKTCCEVGCCDPDECCDDGTCVDKCTNTGQCDYGELPSGPYPNCQALQDPVTGRCGTAEGLICKHFVTIAVNDAECADCEPGCDKERISPCIEIIPYRCTEHSYVIWYACLCDMKLDEREYRGDHYECAD